MISRQHPINEARFVTTDRTKQQARVLALIRPCPPHLSQFRSGQSRSRSSTRPRHLVSMRRAVCACRFPTVAGAARPCSDRWPRMMFQRRTSRPRLCDWWPTVGSPVMNP